jgi:F0F1-type ATP synthase assembly protein I
MPPPGKPSDKKDPFVSLARYSEIGFIIPSAVLLGFFLGKLLDYWLHTKWLYLVGLLFGAVVGFWQVIRMALGAFGKDSDSPVDSTSSTDSESEPSSEPRSSSHHE